jgi:hypothetical protein
MDFLNIFLRILCCWPCPNSETINATLGEEKNNQVISIKSSHPINLFLEEFDIEEENITPRSRVEKIDINENNQYFIQWDERCFSIRKKRSIRSLTTRQCVDKFNQLDYSEQLEFLQECIYAEEHDKTSILLASLLYGTKNAFIRTNRVTQNMLTDAKTLLNIVTLIPGNKTSILAHNFITVSTIIQLHNLQQPLIRITFNETKNHQRPLSINIKKTEQLRVGPDVATIILQFVGLSLHPRSKN